jgi:3-deoxy-7-phosphoheptulonate synthase/chorismate mutase
VALADLRSRVDALNLQLLDLIERRGRLVLEIAVVKQESDLPLRDLDREREMLDRVLGAARGLYSDEELRQLFRALFAASFALLGRAVAAEPAAETAPRTGPRKVG